jgi:hypothetical protein
MPSLSKVASFPCCVPKVLQSNTRHWSILLAAAVPLAQRRAFYFLHRATSLQAKKGPLDKYHATVTLRDQRRSLAMAMKKSDYLSEVWKDGIFSKPTPYIAISRPYTHPSQTTKWFSAQVATAPSAVPKYEQWSIWEPMPALWAATSKRPNPWPNRS